MTARLPRCTPREVIAALKRAGFFVDHIRGSHHYLRHPEHPHDIVLVAYHNRDLKRGTMHSIIKQAGMTPEEFSRLL